MLHLMQFQGASQGVSFYRKRNNGIRLVFESEPLLGWGLDTCSDQILPDVAVHVEQPEYLQANILLGSQEGLDIAGLMYNTKQTHKLASQSMNLGSSTAESSRAKQLPPPPQEAQNK